MTTKPKAKKFRIRRSANADAGVGAEQPQAPSTATSAQPRAAAPQAQSPTPAAPRRAGPAPAAPQMPPQTERVENVLRSKPAQAAPRQPHPHAQTQASPTQAQPQPATARPAPRPNTPAQAAPATAQQAAAQTTRPARPTEGAREYAQNIRQQAAQQSPQTDQTQANQRQAGQAQTGHEQPDPAQAAQMQAGQMQAGQARDGMVASPEEVSADQEIDAIRREGLTGRQLRMARRVAQKHGLSPTSDFDAVRLLRASGIEPFKRTNPLELVVPSAAKASGRAQLPQTVTPGASTLPSTEMAPAERRLQEISAIQQDIAQRRRRKMVLLMTRLAFFVFLPTLLVAWYFAFVASPLYSSRSEFLVLQADSSGGGGMRGLLAGTQFATNQDAIAVQKFLVSQPAMIRLDEEYGFKAHFSQDSIDPVRRLPVDATNKAAYKLYKRYVKIGYDPTEGVVHMEVIAADAQTAATFSNALISYAEEKVDELSLRKRDDQMREARTTLQTAKEERDAAQRRLVELQEGTLLDPQGEIASIRALISNVELQLQDKELQLNTQLNNPRPNRPKVRALETEIRLLREELTRQKARLNEAQNGESSLAALSAEIQMANADVATAQLFLESALQNERQTAQAAARQVRYLTTAVSPLVADAPSYPRTFENTILAFLIMSGVYLMISLTASILREQVST